MGNRRNEGDAVLFVEVSYQEKGNLNPAADGKKSKTGK